jgi:hypothetical protein
MAWREPANTPPVIVAVSAESVTCTLDRMSGGARKDVMVLVVCFVTVAAPVLDSMLSEV